jgi:hypothetical protein
MTIVHPPLRRTLIALTATATAESPSPSKSKSPKPSKQTSPPESVDEVTVDVTIKGDDVTPVAQQVELGVGETLVLNITSDRAGELHVHSSPEQELAFPAGSSNVDVTIDKPGSVDIEEHDSGALLVRVLVK